MEETKEVITLSDKEPNYVLKTKESTIILGKPNGLARIGQIFIWIALLFFVGCLILFGETPFTNFPSITKILFVSMLFKFGFVKGKKVSIPTDIEFKFNDNCLIIHRPSRLYDKNIVSSNKNIWYQETYTIDYSQLESIIYNIRTKKCRLNVTHLQKYMHLI